MDINPDDTMNISMELNVHSPIPRPIGPPPHHPILTAITSPAPNIAHTHTIILLHAKNQDGADFMHELLIASPNTSGRTLPQEFPSVKWVFPSAPFTYNTTGNQPQLRQWCDVYDTRRPWEKGELQFEGLTRGREFIRRVINEEALLLREQGGHEKVLIGGISQGSAMALSVFLGSGRQYKLGGFLGLCGWMPVLNCEDDRPSGWMDGFRKTVHERILRAPVLLEHSLGDDVVSYENFKRMRDVLIEVGFEVRADEHEFAGHWIGEEGLEGIGEWLFQTVGVPTDQFVGRRMEIEGFYREVGSPGF